MNESSFNRLAEMEAKKKKIKGSRTYTWEKGEKVAAPSRPVNLFHKGQLISNFSSAFDWIKKKKKTRCIRSATF